jgi:hypothetical protein
MERLEGAVAGQLQRLVRWLVAWRVLLSDLVCCTSNLKLSGRSWLSGVAERSLIRADRRLREWLA